MHPVSYSPCSLDFTFILYRSSRARRACCCSTRLTSPLAYCFISPEKFPVPPFLSSIYHTLYHDLSDTSSHMHVHSFISPISSYTLSLTSNGLYQLALVLEIETLTETILHAQRRQRATLNALVEDSLKKSTEGHHYASTRSQLPLQDVYTMCERRTAMESSRAELIVPRGAQ
ncbi:hypothetical protein F5888DRAFT_1660582 [Russula emetica]|nr:hypothetical protein F5888DRAFT_1660582 [Russula emetica]